MKPSRLGSNVAETCSSLYRKTGGMSLNDTGVDATKTVCSSEEICFGTEVNKEGDGILQRTFVL